MFWSSFLSPTLVKVHLFKEQSVCQCVDRSGFPVKSLKILRVDFGGRFFSLCQQLTGSADSCATLHERSGKSCTIQGLDKMGRKESQGNAIITATCVFVAQGLLA